MNYPRTLIVALVSSIALANHARADYTNLVAPRAVQGFQYFVEAEEFDNVGTGSPAAMWSITNAAGFFGGGALVDAKGTNSPAHTFVIPQDGTYYIWAAHEVDPNQYTTYDCIVETGGVTVARFTNALNKGAAHQRVWERHAVTLKQGVVTLKLAHNPRATLKPVVDAFEIVGDPLFTPTEDASRKTYSFFVEAENLSPVDTSPAHRGWYRVEDATNFNGARVGNSGTRPNQPMHLTFSVPQDGTYYIWACNYVVPTLSTSYHATVRTGGVAVVTWTFAANTNSAQGNVWERGSAVPLKKGMATLDLTRDPSAWCPQVDAFHIVADPEYVPEWPLGQYVGDAPEFSFRVRVDAVTPAQTALTLRTTQTKTNLAWDAAVGNWTEWIEVADELHALYQKSSGRVWPFRARFTMDGATGLITNLALTVEWKMAGRTSETYTATYRDFMSSSPLFTLFLWKDSFVPGSPYHIGPVSAYDQHHFIDFFNALNLATNNLPKQFTIMDGFSCYENEPKALRDGLSMLMRLGDNTFFTDANWPTKNILTGLGCTNVFAAIYCPPVVFDSDTNQTTDAVMDKWAHNLTKVVTSSGWLPDNLKWFVMWDEPGWAYGHTAYDPIAGSATNHLNAVFRTYLQNKGFTPADFAQTDWSQVKAVNRSAGTTLAGKRNFYWSMRFFTDDCAGICARYARALERAFYPGLPIAMNWGGTRFVTWTSPWAKGPDIGVGGHDWMSYGRERSATALWREDWNGDDLANQWSWFASKLRSAAERYNQRRQPTDPPPISFGGYIVGKMIGAKNSVYGATELIRGGAAQKILGLFGQGGKYVWFYTYGPGYSTGDGWSENFPAYGEIGEGLRLLGKAEDLLYPAQPPVSQVALLDAQSAQVWDTYASPGGAWFGYADYEMESRHLYHALQDSSIYTDWIDETDLLTPAILDRYKVLFITAPNLATNAVTALTQWINHGGTAVFMAGAGRCDIYNETNSLLNTSLGLESSTVRPRVYLPEVLAPTGTVTRANDNLPGNFTGACFIEPLVTNAPGSQVLANFGPDQPAIIERDLGAGHAVVFGTAVGTAYHVNVNTNDAARQWVAWVVTNVAGAVPPVRIDAIKVEGLPMSTTNGMTVTLLNWNTNAVTNANLTITTTREVKQVFSCQLNQSLPFIQPSDKKSLNVTVPTLDKVDVLKLYF